MPPRRLSLTANFAWTLKGNLVYAACQWGMLVVLARLGSPEAVGQFTLALAISAPVFMFTNLQLAAVQATDAKGQYAFGDYFRLRIVATTAALAGILLLAAGLRYSREAALVVLAVALAKAIESVSDIYYGLQQRRERMDRISLSMTSRGVLSLGALAVVFHATGSVAWGALAMAAVWLVVLLAYDLRVAKRLPAEVSEPGRGSLAKLAWLALPLGALAMMMSLNVNIPRSLIAHFLGDRELGLFAAMAYVTVAGSTIMNALGQAASPKLAGYYAGGDLRGFRRVLTKLLASGAVLGAAGVGVAALAGRQVLALLYGAEYAVHNDVFVWLMMATAMTHLAALLGNALTAARCFAAQAPLYLLVTMATTAGCFLLVPGHRLFGAAAAMLLAAMVQLAGSAGMLAYVVTHCPHTPGSLKR